MLTEFQQQFLAKIPEDAVASIHPWDKETAAYAKSLVVKIENEVGVDVFWEGSLALEIPGENDIDLYIFSETRNFDKHLPGIIQILGEPTYTLTEKILWRIRKDGHKIDASLTDKNSPEVQKDMLFFNALKNNPELLQEYASIKVPGLTAREYYRQKNEFYNRVTGNK